MYISTSYYRVLVQELRVFRPQNAPNSVPCNLAANSDQHAGVGRNSALAGSSHCTESHGGPRRATLPTRAIPDAPHKRGPEVGRTGIPCDIAWNDSSHSILNEFMHAEYGIFVYAIWPLSWAAPRSVRYVV